MPSEFFEQFDKAEDYLFDFKGTVDPTPISPEPQQTVYPIWVKASERLPDMETAELNHYRLDGIRSKGELINAEDQGIVFFLYRNRVPDVVVEDLSRVEWLDEEKA